ncbi:unnamed protein product [Allacma fusca]|uniref:DUF4806 domain-containing protein n=1 Tax=Allacma fusca TaxID=39272 RepID=A0A8J2J683_9HEXA|nr:unnamed protein product [Allacma fusca]
MAFASDNNRNTNREELPCLTNHIQQQNIEDLNIVQEFSIEPELDNYHHESFDSDSDHLSLSVSSDEDDNEHSHFEDNFQAVVNPDQDFQYQLRRWAIVENVTHKALDSLLKILSSKVSDLPRTARTLLQTQTVTPVESILEFLGEKKPGESTPCEIVPILWLNSEQTSCFWLGNSAYASTFKKGSTPGPKCKECLPINIKFAHGDLKMVQAKRDHYLMHSDLDSSSQETSTRRTTPRVNDRNVSESSESDSDQGGRPSNLPISPLIDTHVSLNFDSGPILDVNIPNLLAASELTSSVNQSFGRSLGEVKTPRTMERHILYKLEELLRKVDEVSRDVKTLKLSSATVHEPPDGSPHFPLSTKFDLDSCNRYLLADSEHLNYWVQSISPVGGVSVKEATERVLRKLLTNKSATEHNWCGTIKKNCKVKIGLVNYGGIVKLLFGGVRGIKAEATDKDIEDCAKYWLKHAKGRMSSKSEIAQTQEESTENE